MMHAAERDLATAQRELEGCEAANATLLERVRAGERSYANLRKGTVETLQEWFQAQGEAMPRDLRSRVRAVMAESANAEDQETRLLRVRAWR